MLILKICINHNQIDEIHIQNVGAVNYITKTDLYVYNIRKPKGYEEMNFYHFRSDGAIKLINQVISYLDNENYQPVKGVRHKEK